MKKAVIYYSLEGNTAQTAEKIAALTGADIIRLEPQKEYPDKGFKKFLWGGKSAMMAETPKLMPYTFQAEEYGQIVIGFPVWAGNVTPPIRTFVHENRDALKGKSISAFACQSGAGAEKAFGKLKSAMGIDRLEAELILIDPKSKPDAENEQKIKAFCERLHEAGFAGKGKSGTGEAAG